jgi:ribosomal protein S2
MQFLNYTYEQLMIKGLHIGNLKHQRNLFMNKFIYTNYNDIDIINLNSTLYRLKVATNFLKQIFINNGLILTICNTNYTELLPIKNIESQIKQPIIQKNIPGIISNLQKIHISKKYSKYVNIKLYNRCPNLLFIINDENKKNLINQANFFKIPSLIIIDTTEEPYNSTLFIPSNNTTLDVLNFYLNLLKKINIDSYRLRLNNFLKQTLIYKKLPNLLQANNNKNKYRTFDERNYKNILINYQYLLTKLILIKYNNKSLKKKLNNSSLIFNLNNVY